MITQSANPSFDDSSHIRPGPVNFLTDHINICSLHITSKLCSSGGNIVVALS